jgi:hypothetical protein
MLDDHISLDRSFSLVPRSETDSDDQELYSISSSQKRTGWPELEGEFRCVILAEAGAGKSVEMAARARHVAKQGRAAFFIRIEDIEDGFETAFEVGCVDSFEHWLSSQEEAWFFLDSIDEARLGNPRAFERAIRRFAARIKPANQRAHIYISSRPYAWRACSDRELLEQYLPFLKMKSEASGGARDVEEEIEANQPIEPESALRVYLLDPLGENGIRTFATQRGTPQVDRLILELQRKNLMSVAARPFDLEGIIAKWKTDQALDGRLELLQHNIDFGLNEIDPDRAQRQPLNREKARRGARLLAAAVILTGEAGIRVPDSTKTLKGIDAETILGDWEPTDVRALLGRGIFNDALYGMVRFRHREVRELLAAEWFCEQLRNGNSRHAIESLFIREQYDLEVITPRLRPILPWLILFDDEIRHRVFKIAPEVAVEGGDVAHLPFAERRELLNNILRRIVEDQDDRSARDNSAIARIAQPDLTDETLRLITDFQDNDEAIFFLGRLVWQGEMTACVPTLSTIAINPTRDIYARIASTRAAMTCGAREQKDQLWEQLIALPQRLPRKLLAELVEGTTPDMVSINFLLASIGKLEAYDRYQVTGLGQSLHHFIDRLPHNVAIGAQDLLTTLVSGLKGYLAQEPYFDHRQCQVSQEFAWLLGPATHAVERLVFSRSEASHSSDALSIMLKVPVSRHWDGDDYKQYKSRLDELVPAWHDLNDALFWRSIEEAREQLESEKSERLTDDWSVQWIGHYWRFGLDRFRDVLNFIVTRDLLDDRLVALSLAYRLFLQADKPDELLTELQCVAEGDSELKVRLEALLYPKKPSRLIEWEEEDEIHRKQWQKAEEEKARCRVEWIERLKKEPDAVRHPPGLGAGEISNDQYWLLGEILGSDIRTHRDDGANWQALIPEFGDEVALAYRDAALSHWRNYRPGLRSEGHDTSSVSNELVFAMAGLTIEARESQGFPTNLTGIEIRHALRYHIWEINGLPSWLEQIHRFYPKLVLHAILTELYWELEHTEPDQPMHYILHDLVYHAPWMHQCLAPSLIAWMENYELVNPATLGDCIHILLSGNADDEKLSQLAQSKIASNTAYEQQATWYALWVALNAEEAIPAVEQWLLSLSTENASKAAQLFITRLMDTLRTASTDSSRSDSLNVKQLKALYVLMHFYIRAQDDIDRSGKGVYSPGLRDEAQDARNFLLSQLAVIPGKDTYIALTELAREHPNANYRPWMYRWALKRAIEDSDLEPWSAQQMRDFYQYQERTPTTHRQLFDLSVHRLIDLKHWLECGNDSPYKTWQRAERETEMRNLIAGWLNSHSMGRYSCVQENELPNGQRPDLFLQNPHIPSPVPIELKLLDKGWSGEKLCERLRNQLAGDYLREETAGCGVMLLVWQGLQFHWQFGDKKVELKGLVAALKSYWSSIANQFPGVSAIDVILIDLTVRDAKSKV